MKRAVSALLIGSMLISCGGDSGSSKSGSKKGLKVKLTERAKQATAGGARAAQNSRFSMKSGTAVNLDDSHDNVLSSFNTAFSLGDSATYSISNIPVYDENGRLQFYEAASGTRSVTEIKADLAVVMEKDDMCENMPSDSGMDVDVDSDMDIDVDADADIEIGDIDFGDVDFDDIDFEDGEVITECEDEIDFVEYKKADYEELIASLFDLEKLVKSLKSEAQSGEVLVDVVDYNLEGNAISFTFTMEGTIDGEEIDATILMEFRLDLPFVANPTTVVFAEEGVEPQTISTTSVNGTSIQ